MNNIFLAGEPVPYSGIYRITHYPPHTTEEPITLTEGNPFPLYVDCAGVSFMLGTNYPRANLLIYAHEL
jgi:hypothetical protein